MTSIKINEAMKDMDELSHHLQELDKLGEGFIKGVSRKDIAETFVNIRDLSNNNQIAAAITFYFDKKGNIVNSHLHLKDEAHKLLTMFKR